MTRLFVTASLFLCMTASAGKAEREYMKSDVEPAVKDAEAKFKAACGCAIKLTVTEGTSKNNDDLYQVKHIAESVAAGPAAYCNDAASKKAVCQMKTLQIVRGTATTFTFKDGVGVATHDGQSYCSWDMMTHELDK